MDVQFFCPRWGSEVLSWPEFAEKVYAAGYDGIEYAISQSASDPELEEAWNSAERYGLLIIPQHYDTFTADYIQHQENYQSWLERIAKYPALKINSQTGKDFFTFEQNRKLIELGNRFNVLHETHRGKFSFAAHITRSYLDAIPELKLTLDVSHWVCVAESLLEDQSSDLSAAIARTRHLHTRVGYAEGPQVADPRAAEWKTDLERHLFWWNQVAAAARERNEVMTISPEFGPYPYLAEEPHTRRALADQWAVNLWMTNLLKERYA